MTTAGIVILTIVITIAALSVGYLTLKSKKAGEVIPWDKIRPILTDVFLEAQNVIKADSMGYGALENYAVNFVKSQVDASTFLSDSEKALISVELIRSVIGPRLQELYNSKG
jgi:hypothetical protein